MPSGATPLEQTGPVFLDRKSFEHAAGLALKYVAPFSAGLALLYLAMEGYDANVDPQWEAARDMVLRGATRVLRSKFQSGFIMYLGHGTFGILATDLSAHKAEGIAQAVLAGVAQIGSKAAGATHRTQAYLGGVIINSMREINELFSLAEIAARVARQKSGRRVHIVKLAEEELLRWQDDLLTINRVNAATLQDRFVVYRQEIIPIQAASATATHTELTVRMLSADGRPVQHGSLHSAAMRFGVAARFDRYVIEKIAQSLGYWNSKESGLPESFSLPVSSATMAERSFPAYVEQVLRRYRVPANAVCFEVTEADAVENIVETTRFIQEVHSQRAKVALRDFGNRGLLLARIAGFAVDHLKISRELVNNLEDPAHRSIAQAICQISRSLGIKTVALGVGDRETLERARVAGFDYAQGAYIGDPTAWTARGLLRDAEAVTGKPEV